MSMDKTIRGAGGGGGSAHTPVEAPDSLHSLATFRILDLISEGEIGGLVNGQQSIYLNQTPLANADGTLNFQNVQIDSRNGTQTQDPIKGYTETDNEISVGVELKSGTPWVQSLSDLELSAVRITLGWPALSKANTSNGDINGYSISYHMDLQVDGGAWTTVYTSAVTGKTTSKYQRSTRIDLPAATTGWAIRVVRDTPNQNSSSIADTMTVDSYAEIVDGKLRYPNSALVAVAADAKQFDNIPTRAYDVFGRIIQVPSNYDPVARAYSGTWDGTFKPSWTDNPAWVYYDLATNDRFGLGGIMGQPPNKWDLYRIAQYCDELVDDGFGGQEPRFTFSNCFNSQDDAFKVLQDLASVFRGITFWSGSALSVSADMPADPVYVYAPANVINGQFTYQSTPKNQRFTTALVTWLDPSNFYTASQHYVQNDDGLARYGIVPTTLTALGATTQGQAHRAGLWALLTAQNATQSASFSVGLDGLMAAPGQIIRIADPGRAGKRQGGRLSAATATSITVDRLPDVVSVGDSLTVILPSGVSETHAITAMSGNTISIASPGFTETPVADAMWTSESATLVAQLFRVTNVKENKSDSSLTFDITAVQHVPGKYANIDSGTILTLPPISQLPSAVQPPPTNVTVSSHVVVTQGAANPVMTIAWDVAAGATHYQVEWQRDNVQWTTAGTVTTASIDVPGIYSGSYIARVTAFNAGNVASLPAVSAATTIAGKTEPPPPPTLTATGGQLEIKLTWAWPTGVNVEDTSYTEVWVSDDSTMADGSSVGAVAYPGTTYTITGLLPEDARYAWVRLVDKSGNVGAWSLPAHAVGGTVTDLFQPLQDQVTQLNTDVGTVQTDVNNAVASITQEVSDRTAGDAANATAITQEQTDRTAAVKAQADALTQEVSDRTAAITAEATARQQAIDAQADALTQEVSDRTAAITAEATARQQAIDAQASAQSEALAQEAQARGAAITAEQTARQDADSSLTDTISTNTAAIGANTSAIQTEQTARVTADNSEANTRTLLATQMRGSYTGTDLTQITSGLIASERDARSTQYESVVQQMSQLQAGVGEQFDYAQIWYFTDGVDGWTGTQVDGSWLLKPSTTDATLSPVGLGINSAEYTQVRFRVKRVGAPVWSGIVGLYAVGASGSNYTAFNPPEPAWDDDNIGVVMVDTSSYTGVTDQMLLRGDSTTGDAANYYLFDWVAVGRPAPGASSAALSQEATARATADTAEVTSRQQLSVALTGLTDPSGTPLTSLPNGLLVDERDARVTADESQLTAITALQSTVGQNTSAITTESTTRATADDALGDRIDAVTATAGANTSAITAEATARADGDSANAQQIGQMQSQSGFVFRDVFDEADPSTRWTRVAGGTYVNAASDDSILGGELMTVSGSGVYLIATDRIPFDPSKLYRFRVRMRNNNAASTSAGTYIGFVGFAADKTTYVNVAGANSTGSQHYATHKSAGFVEYVGYTKGWAASTGSAPDFSTSDFANPGVANAGVRYIAPALLANYQDTSGATTDIDYFIIEDADALGQALTAQAQVATEATTRASADSALSSQLTSLTTTVNGKADQSTVDSLSSTVTQQGDTLTSQGTSITSLQSSLDTTNDNVTTAQTAADNAATAAASAAGIANGKGKVLIQSTAPAAADQLAQNLWIDTTGGANTPKTWNGSAWTVVTDKTATDAAAAAAAAQTAASAAQQAANTNAGAISSMQSTVTQQGNTITAQGQSITALQGTVGDNTSAITAEQTARADGDSANAQQISQMQSQSGFVFRDVFDAVDPTVRWHKLSGGTISDVASDDSVMGGSMLNAVGGSTYIIPNDRIPFDPDKLYRVRIRVRINDYTSGGGCYIGLVGFAADKTTYVNTHGDNSTGAQHYAVEYPTGLTEYVAYIKGHSALGQSPNFGGPFDHPTTLNDGVRFFAPAIIANYQNTDTNTDIDYFIIEDADALGQALTAQAQVATEATTRASADSALSSQLTSLTTTVNGKADQSTVDSLSSTVTQQGDTLTSQGTSITSLQSSLDTTNDNVTTAQTAADNAATAAASAAGIANGKGKVLIQSTAPAAADQLAQNLWIDTTGGANTPKTWNGSAWTVVTDKTATDAAAAAAAAQTAASAAQQAANTNAGAISSMQSTVTQQGNTITAQGQSITALQGTVGQNSSAITAEQTARADGDSANAAAITSLQSTFNAADAKNLDEQFEYGGQYWATSAITTGTATPPASTGGAIVSGAGTDGGNVWELKSASWFGSRALIPVDTSRAYEGALRIRQTIDSSDTTKNRVYAGYIAFDANKQLLSGNGGTYGYFIASGVAITTAQGWQSFAGTITGEGTATNTFPVGTRYIRLLFNANNSGGDGTYQIDSLTFADVTDAAANAASITSEATTRAAADGALSTQLNTVQATANAAATQASLNNEVSTRAAADTAIASDVALLGAHNANKSAFVLNQNTVQVDGSTTFAQMLTGINATASANTSAASAAQTSATNAANAAAAASGIANGKADVLIQSTAPSAAMQKATTLWIDTTSNANTPKTWNGSAWTVVTDKAATDAAAAAAAAQATATAAQTAATQAQANINTEATTRADADTALGQRIDTVNATVGDNTAAINAEQTARADGDSANASAITAVQSSVGFQTALSWTFNANHNGFAANNASLAYFPAGGAPNYGAEAMAVSAYDPQFLSPAISVNGALCGTVRAMVRRRVASGDWDGTLFYRTASHNFSASYSAVVAAPAGSDWALLEWDMTGISDWMSSTITGLRFDLEQNTAGATTPVTDIQWIALGNPNASGASVASQMTASSTIGGTSYAAATVMIDANGHIGGTRLASDGTTSSFVVVADQFQVIAPAGGARTEYSGGTWRVYDASGVLRVEMGALS